MSEERAVTRRAFFGGAALAAMQLLAPAAALAEDGNGRWDNSGEIPVWVDSIGRRVEVPGAVGKVAPTGVYAESVLASIDPALLASSAAGSRELEWLGVGSGLPVTGGLYSATEPLDVEAVKAASPDLIVDIGELKPTTEVDLDMLQEETGIPAVFVHSDFVHLCRAYGELSRLLGSERAADLSEYAYDVASYVRAGASCVGDGSRYSLYVGEGADGSRLRTDGSLLGEAVEEVGCDLPSIGAGTRTRSVSNADLLDWDPDVVVLADRACYESYRDQDLGSKIAWDCTSAGALGCVRGSAIAGGLWLGDLTPLSRQLVGSLYLGNLLYPDIYQYEYGDVVEEYYSLFFGKHSLANSVYSVNEAPLISAEAIRARKRKRRQGFEESAAAEAAYEEQWQAEQEEKAREIMEREKAAEDEAGR